MNDELKKMLDNMSEKERKIALLAMNELAQQGKSKTYEDIIYSDYKEIPVDIQTFLTDDNYLGKAWKDANGKCKLYPFWLDVLKKIFPNNIETAFDTLLESGARGLGKSEIACGVVCPYLMYRVMCLKNPLQFYHIKLTEKIAFAFMNIKLELSEAIAVDKFQKTIQMSPWFMARGSLTQRNNKQYWVPPEPLEIIIGSQSDDVIGRPIFYCLDGDTEIFTDKGVFRIEDLVDKEIKVPTVNNNTEIELSETCTVKPTGLYQDEYEIELEDGTVIKCTPNHRFMLKDGSYKEAKDLTLEDELFDIDRYGYIYKTTNLINGKIYIGQKKSKKFLENKYLGSGNLLISALAKYGKDNFKVELLAWCSSQKMLDEMETYYIDRFQSKVDAIGYNIALGGHASLDEKSKDKIRQYNLGKHLSEEVKQKISASNKGKVLSEETKHKMSNSAMYRNYDNYHSNKGRLAITDSNQVKYIETNEAIPEGWSYGNCHTSAKHDMTNYYNDPAKQARNSAAKSGSNNSMYGNGYRISGGKNGKAKIEYFYKDKYFDCRKDLLVYLKTIDSNISENLIRNIEHSSYKTCTKRKYGWLIAELKWRYKDED